MYHTRGGVAEIVTVLKKYWPLLALIVVGVLSLAMLGPGGCGEGGGGEKVKLPSGLAYQDLKVGDGKEAKTGDTVSVHYTGWLAENDFVFDSSHKRGEPFTFELGAGRVIKGWDEGVAGMKVGGKRKLFIPAKLGYGPRQQGDIPPNSDLVFEVELLDVPPK